MCGSVRGRSTSGETRNRMPSGGCWPAPRVCPTRARKATVGRNSSRDRPALGGLPWNCASQIEEPFGHKKSSKVKGRPTESLYLQGAKRQGASTTQDSDSQVQCAANREVRPARSRNPSTAKNDTTPGNVESMHDRGRLIRCFIPSRRVKRNRIRRCS